MEQKVFVTRKLENNPFYMAPVEIIIPFNGEQTSVSKLMDSIFRTVHTNRYLITLVDDGSQNSAWIKEIEKAKLPGVRCLRQEEQKGFGSAVNLALKNPFNKNIIWVAVLHSDVDVQDNNWLSSLGECLNKLKGQGVKMVSPLTNNPGPQTLFASKKGHPKQDLILDYNKDKEVPSYLPMYCFLSHRELFDRVGLFQEFPYCGLESQEFASRMLSKGYKQAIAGKSWVYHSGGATINRYKNDTKVQEIIRKNQIDYLANGFNFI